MPQIPHNTPISPITSKETSVGEAHSGATLPVTPARYAELQRNGLYGVAPERRYIRPDLQDSPYEDLAEVSKADLSPVMEQ